MRVDQERWEKSKVDLEGEIAGLKGYLASLPPQLEEMLGTTTQVSYLYYKNHLLGIIFTVLKEQLFIIVRFSNCS